jgi:NAD(P)-dependent dehydrogenase (short-subunit alcohol dehydrogenase family)
MGRATGKVALVTGAAGGQGRSHALRLAAEGADIIAIDGVPAAGRPPARPAGADLDETAAMVAELGSRVVTARADVRDHGPLAAAVDEAAGTLGRLDIVVAAAAIRGSAPAHELAEECWQDMIDVNLTGAWLTCKVAVPHVIAGGRGGSVVLASSAAGVRPYPAMAHYVAAEHAIIGLAKTLAQELGGEQIRVNALIPALAGAGPDGLLPSPAQPRDVSEALLFLISDAGRHITGAALPVDAGVLAR